MALVDDLAAARAALELAEQALRIGQEIGSSRYQGYAWMTRGHALAALERFPEAREAYQRARSIRVETRMSHQEMESVAGLASVALATGDAQEAQGYAGELLAYLERASLHGTEEPFWIRLVCFRVLQAHQDARAEVLLEKAHQLLQEWAGRLHDEALRRSFLGITAHRQLLEEWRRLGKAEDFDCQGDGIA